ncbi:methyltransferase domain-containing protein [Candidatus Daviesbacteria bacterium]|nr:methyltransferase domain-containing protein [Candidatus Daviesbacteria bacterium]
MNAYLIDKFTEIEDFHWWFEGRRQILSKIFKKFLQKKLEDVVILDIGCGTGSNIKFLSNFGNVHGIDNMKLAIDYCKKKGAKKVKLANACKLPYRNRMFDVVVFLDVLEHIENDELAIKEAKRVLKKNGLIIITVPALPIIWSQHDSMQNHHRRYRRDEIESLAENANLKILNMVFFNFLLSFPIVIIRFLSKISLFKGLGEHDSQLNFNLAKIRIINKILLTIFKTEIAFSKFINYPFGISLLAVIKK